MAGISALGTTFSIGGTLVGELTNVSGPSKSKDTIDTTTHSSADGFRTFVGGLKDGGEVTLEGLFTNEAGQAALNANYEGDVAAVCVVAFPLTPAVTATFDGLVTALSITGPHDGELGFSATIKVSGKPVIASGVSANLTNLTGIEQQAGAALTFIPAFAGATYSYVASVNTASTWIKLTPTGAGVIRVQDAIVSSGAQSGEVPLGAAGSLTTVTVTATETGKAPKTYTITVARA